VVLAAVSAVVVVGSSFPALRAQSASADAPTYTRDVAPILYKNCTGCHRPGEIEPMPLLTYSDVRPRVRAISTRVSAGTMPPWHADGAAGEFLNDRRLSEKDKATIQKWVENGAPEGDAKDLPPAPKYADGWAIGQPDAVVKMGEDYPIPATGTIAYQYFEVPTNFTEDRWVTAYEVRPGNRAVVHHVIVTRRRRHRRRRRTQPRPKGSPRVRVRCLSLMLKSRPSGGQTGERCLRISAGPGQTIVPRGLGNSIGECAGNGARVLSAGHGDAAAGRRDARLPDALHVGRQADDGSDEHRVHFLEGTAQDHAGRPALINGSPHIPAGA
jgi:hypothetical protein